MIEWKKALIILMTVNRKGELAIFAAIVLIAAIFRFSQLELYPPGLYPDEAMNGNNALQALDDGNFKVFYPENNGREGLFINLQAFSIKWFGNTAWSLRAVSALVGTLTVAGLYLLTRRLFNWQIAAISSFLMAVSFWHVVFSRIGFRAIMAPFFLVWALYFLWRGLSLGKIWNFAIGGAFLGLGAYTYLAFRVMPAVVVLVLIGYWQTIRKHFTHAKYQHTQSIILVGVQLFVTVAIVTAFPLLHFFYQHPDLFFGRTAQVSVFSSEHVLSDLVVNTFKTLGMFTFSGDYNWRHNYAGEPLLFWPVGAFFAVGLLLNIIQLVKIKKKHGHFGTVQTMLLSWFALSLVPVVLSSEGLPHALRAIIAAPVVFIFAGQGVWWLFTALESWYRVQDVHEIEVTLPDRHEYHLRESMLAIWFVLLVFLGTIGAVEYDKYFHRWAVHKEVAGAFNQNYVQLAERINALPREQIKYVLVNAGGSEVNGIPMPAQTVMYLTDTWTPEKQKAKNIYYLTPEQHRQKQYLQNSTVFPLE